ncbi:N-acetylglucosaminyldiphosphoundecaprenol N-acetyl-beta-D-mannosaminyltransferase [Devosia crocina]|uniref:N-acetylglucosaminyldiphosphoundecaprenol N-acetyl-beta-D-mannosaminyltransferase n=1 Tax=Devosia crocina TaxID=429728 RepID=A0A1I7N1J9_9HYPH|nr:WecB/TagA/CpsF family glycosyltransferase [Devosia crocina]SFV28514.1 N-acetylglucosaminyldiphosphoundecaprenol N-acetyl-beta-D-mannosaminyltransferase [Devosia crocina]
MSCPSAFSLFGIPVAVTSLQDLASRIESWRGSSRTHVVCFSDAHGLVRGHDEPGMAEALTQADIVAPDGQPLVWAGRLLFGVAAERVAGPDFLAYLASRSAGTGLRHYFFGGRPGVAELLAARLLVRYPGIEIVGTDARPMGISTPAETAAQLARINAARPDIVWIGLGAPKQEIWMHRHRDQLPGLTLCGVGAAFDFHAGLKPRAPRWMREHGLEWLFRALSEPRRLGPRYAVVIPRFIFLLLRQALAMRRSGAMRFSTKRS